MDSNKFNTWIWKINGIIILLAGIGILLVALFGLYDTWQRTRQPQQIVNIADDPKGIEKWTLGRGEEIWGTKTLMLSLISENKEVLEQQSMQMFSSGKSFVGRAYSNPAKNVLFLNMENNQSSWLFNSTSQLIISTEVFPYRYSEFKENREAKVIFYSVVTKDSNNDGSLNNEDSSSLAITDANGLNYQVIIKAFDRIISKAMVGENQVMIIFQNQGIAYSMLVSISPYKIISINELPRVKK